MKKKKDKALASFEIVFIMVTLICPLSLLPTFTVNLEFGVMYGNMITVAVSRSAATY